MNKNLKEEEKFRTNVTSTVLFHLYNTFKSVGYVGSKDKCGNFDGWGIMVHESNLTIYLGEFKAGV